MAEGIDNLSDGNILSRARKKFDMFLLAISHARLVLRDFQAYGIRRTHFILALISGGLGRFLALIQFGLLYKALNALILGNKEAILNGPAGKFFRLTIPHKLQESNWIWVYIIGTAVLVKVLEIFFSYRSERYLFNNVRRIQGEVNNKIFERTLRFSLSFFDLHWRSQGTTWSDIVNILTQRTQAYAEQLKTVYLFSMGCLTAVLFLFAVIVLNFKIFLFALIVIPVSRYLGALVMGGVADAWKLEKDLRNEQRMAIANVVGGMLLVKCQNMEAAELAQFQAANQAALDEVHESSKVQLLEGPVNGISKMLSTTVLSSTVPFDKASGQKKTLSGTLIGIMAVQQIENSIDSIIRTMKGLFNYEEQRIEIERICGKAAEGHFLRAGYSGLKGFNKKIELRDLSFEYYEDRPVLKKISIAFEKNKTTAIVGQTGSGKSTIAKILLRLYNVSPGSYCIDGREVNEYNLASVRDLFAYVSQETAWFHSSIRKNLIYGLKREVSDDEIESYCRQMGIWRAITKIPGGLDGNLTSRGGSLSGGELQCLALVRALLKQSEVLILDEPTSSLDALTEVRVQEAIDRVSSMRTIIVIAHRLSTISKAHKVLVLHHGTVLEAGSVPELIQAQGKFYDLWKSQGAFWRTTAGLADLPK